MSLVLALLLATLSLLSFESFAETKDLTWVRWDDPPIFIFHPPYNGQGVLDAVEKELRLAMPQYNHKTLEAPVPRVLKEAKAKSPICNAGWLDTPEWTKLFYFSKPVLVIPTNGVLLKKSRAQDFFKEKGPYSLQKFLDKRPDWVLGVGRLYGEGIDEVLFKNKYLNNPKIFPASSSLLVHRMLHLDRVQYTIGYPFEAQYYNELLKSKNDEVVHVPLSDNAAFVEVVVGCPKTPWGAKVISDVNKILNSRARIERMNLGLNRWLSPADQNRLISERAKFYKKYYPTL